MNYEQENSIVEIIMIVITFIAIFFVPFSIIYFPFAIRNFIKWSGKPSSNKKKATYRRSFAIPLIGLLLGIWSYNSIQYFGEEDKKREAAEAIIEREREEIREKFIAQINQYDNDMNAKCLLDMNPYTSSRFSTLEEYLEVTEERFCPNDLFSNKRKVLLCKPHLLSKNDQEVMGLNDRYSYYDGWYQVWREDLALSSISNSDYQT